MLTWGIWKRDPNIDLSLVCVLFKFCFFSERSSTKYYWRTLSDIVDFTELYKAHSQ
jgi:hypothetical protein